MSDKKFIRSVNDLLESIEFTNLKRENFAFRGQVNEDWDITSTIMRKSDGSLQDFRKSKEIEYASLKSLLQGQKSDFCRTYHPIEHLMHLQHLAIPTRLIDWTRDILVALFFACYDKNNTFKDKHGKIFLLLIIENEFKNFDLFYEKENISFKKHNIQLIQKSLMNDLMQLKEIKIIEPMLKNPRMRIQDGIFTLIPLWKSNEKIGHCKSFNEMLKEIKKPLLEHYIHKDYKKEILIELEEMFGISEESLFINSKTILEEEEKSMKILDEDLEYIEKLFLNRKV